jgi:hypothetical protein
VYQLGVDENLLYLGLGAVAAHVLLLEHLSEAGSPLQAVDDVLEDLLLSPASGPSPVPPITLSQNDPCSAIGIDLLLLLQDAPRLYPYPRLR